MGLREPTAKGMTVMGRIAAETSLILDQRISLLFPPVSHAFFCLPLRGPVVAAMGWVRLRDRRRVVDAALDDLWKWWEDRSFRSGLECCSRDQWQLL